MTLETAYKPLQPSCSILTSTSSALTSEWNCGQWYAVYLNIGHWQIKGSFFGILKYIQNSAGFSLQTADTVLLPVPKKSVFEKTLLTIFLNWFQLYLNDSYSCCCLCREVFSAGLGSCLEGKVRCVLPTIRFLLESLGYTCSVSLSKITDLKSHPFSTSLCEKSVKEAGGESRRDTKNGGSPIWKESLWLGTTHFLLKMTRKIPGKNSGKYGFTIA